MSFKLSVANDEAAVLTGVGTLATGIVVFHLPLVDAIGYAVLAALGILGYTGYTGATP